MKSFTSLCLCLSLSSPLLLSQCSSVSQGDVSAQSQMATPTANGYVTTQRMGDTTILTRTLIRHQLTNADIGKTYQEITVVSPRGTSVQERVIVRALPRLETANRTKS